VTILAAMEAEPSHERAILEHTAFLIREFSREWHREVPEKIHSGQIDEGGNPAFHPDFIAYVDRPCHRKDCFNAGCNHGMRSVHPDSRVRVTRAFRRLRVEAPREFDALYLIARHNYTLSDVARRLTDRAIALGHPQRYDETGAMLLTVSAAHKVEQWW
jgi:hypothetical protein